MARRGRAAVIVALLVVAAVVTVAAGATRSPEGLRYDKSQEVIVVLGLQLHSDDMPRAGLKRRVLRGVALWRQKGGSALLLLSGARKAPSVTAGAVVTEASAMREIALCAGVPPSSLWTEDLASNTAENAFYSAAWLRRVASFTAIDKVSVVTSDWHVARATLPFETFIPPHVALEMVGAPDFTSEEKEARDVGMLPSTLRDMAAIAADHLHPVWASVARYLRRNGQASVLVGKGVAPPPSSLKPCTDEEHAAATVVVLGALVGALSPCEIAPIVFVEAHARQAARFTSVKLVRGTPLTSSTWLYRLECSDARRNVADYSCLTFPAS